MGAWWLVGEGTGLIRHWAGGCDVAAVGMFQTKGVGTLWKIDGSLQGDRETDALRLSNDWRGGSDVLFAMMLEDKQQCSAVSSPRRWNTFIQLHLFWLVEN